MYSAQFDNEYFWKIFNDVFPLQRSLLSPDTEKSHELIFGQNNLFVINKVPSGREVFDWKIPQSWSIEKFDIYTEDGEQLCSLSESNLHILGNSSSFKGTVSFSELEEHLYSLSDLPNAIPYLTSYYSPNWGICLSYNQYKKLDRSINYDINIDTKFEDGDLITSNYFKKGKSSKEIIFTSYLCHPSMANNELVAPILLSMLAKYIDQLETYWSYRIVVTAETIGAISYINSNLQNLKNNAKAGFVITCFGDPGQFSIVHSRYKNTVADKIILDYNKKSYKNFNSYDWLDRGSDERQFCSPNVSLPFCTICRSKFGKYKEYHTSLDNKEFITNKSVEDSFHYLIGLITYIETLKYPVSKIKCEPFMTKYNLYPSIGGSRDRLDIQKVLDVHSYCDGQNSLDDLSKLCKIPFVDIENILDLLESKKLISYE